MPNLNDSKRGSQDGIFNDSYLENIHLNRIGESEGNSPLPLVPPPSDNIETIRASKAKYARLKRALSRDPQEGDSVASKKGLEEWTAQDAANLNEYQKKQKRGRFTRPQPLVSPPPPSDDLGTIRAAMVKYYRLKRALSRAPQEGDSVASKKGLEEWTAQDAANLREYQKIKRRGGFTRPQPLVPPPPPSDNIETIKASKAKYARLKRALGRALQQGYSVASKKGLEEWTAQDAANYNEYNKRQRQGEFKASGMTAITVPVNSDQRQDSSGKKRKGPLEMTAQDATNYKEYNNRQRQGEFKASEITAITVPVNSDQRQDSSGKKPKPDLSRKGPFKKRKFSLHTR